MDPAGRPGLALPWTREGRRNSPRLLPRGRLSRPVDRGALADRLVNDGDAVVAFALVNALGFTITLADPEARCSIARLVVLIAVYGAARDPGCSP